MMSSTVLDVTVSHQTLSDQTLKLFTKCMRIKPYGFVFCFALIACSDLHKM